MNPTPLRIALLGSGSIVRAHTEGILCHPDLFHISAVCDTNAAAAAKLAGELGGSPSVHTDYVAMLDRHAGELDAVLITLPHWLHFPAAAAALERGLSVLVEKPAVCSVSEFRELQRLEKRHGGIVQVGQNQRFGVQENHIRDWFASPAFGEPRLFNVDIYQNIQGYAANQPDGWILDGQKAGGGIVTSVAVHILDLLRYWFDDDYTEVHAVGRFEEPLINGAESTVAATLRMGRGTIGTLNCSYTVKRCPYSQRSLIFGTHGTLYQHMDKPGGGYAGVYHISTDGGNPSPQWGMMYEGFEPVKVPEGANSLPEWKRPFEAQWLYFREAVLARKAGENSLARNFNTVATIEALGRSLRSGQSETVALS